MLLSRRWRPSNCCKSRKAHRQQSAQSATSVVEGRSLAHTACAEQCWPSCISSAGTRTPTCSSASRWAALQRAMWAATNMLLEAARQEEVAGCAWPTPLLLPPPLPPTTVGGSTVGSTALAAAAARALTRSSSAVLDRAVSFVDRPSNSLDAWDCEQGMRFEYNGCGWATARVESQPPLGVGCHHLPLVAFVTFPTCFLRCRQLPRPSHAMQVQLLHESSEIQPDSQTGWRWASNAILSVACLPGLPPQRCPTPAGAAPVQALPAVTRPAGRNGCARTRHTGSPAVSSTAPQRWWVQAAGRNGLLLRLTWTVLQKTVGRDGSDDLGTHSAANRNTTPNKSALRSKPETIGPVKLEAYSQNDHATLANITQQAYTIRMP
jgi:hypothetical protein